MAWSIEEDGGDGAGSKGGGAVDLATVFWYARSANNSFGEVANLTALQTRGDIDVLPPRH